MRYCWIAIAVVLLLACKREQEGDIIPDCDLDMEQYDFAFGIDYDQPEKYLIPGDMSEIDDTSWADIREEIKIDSLNLDGILTVCHWMNRNFRFENAGGANIGSYQVNDLIESRTFYGCHSAALLISSVLRKLGYPVVMIETASILWAYEFVAETNQGMAGHVMSEVYVDDRWILVDNNATCVPDYDCLNPFINTQSTDFYYNRDGLFVIAKGVDIWGYGVQSHEDTHDLMINFAHNLACFEGYFGSVEYRWR